MDILIDTKSHPKLAQIPTHSVADWDFLIYSNWAPASRWDLYTTIHISAPSCLRLWTDASGYDRYALLKSTIAPNLKAGRIVDWLRWSGYSYYKARIYIGVTGPGSKGITIQPHQLINTWYRYRVTWWQGYDTQNEPATVYHLDTWVDDAWVLGSLQYTWSLTGDVNRVGVGVTGGSFPGYAYHDDTQIWEPA